MIATYGEDTDKEVERMNKFCKVEEEELEQYRCDLDTMEKMTGKIEKGIMKIRERQREQIKRANDEQQCEQQDEIKT